MRASSRVRGQEEEKMPRHRRCNISPEYKESKLRENAVTYIQANKTNTTTIHDQEESQEAHRYKRYAYIKYNIQTKHNEPLYANMI
jgi:hypothetical protein